MKVFWNQIVVGDEDEGMVDEVDVGGGGIVNTCRRMEPEIAGRGVFMFTETGGRRFEKR